MKNLKFYMVSFLSCLMLFLPLLHLSALEGDGRGRGIHRGNQIHGNAMHGNQMHPNVNTYNGIYHHNLNGAGNGANSGTVINETPEVVVPPSPQFNAPQH